MYADCSTEGRHMQFARSRRARVAALVVLILGGIGLIGSTNITVAVASGAHASPSVRLGHGIAYPYLHARNGASASPAASAPELKYYGGTADGKQKIGVQVHQKVYLV